MKTALSLLLAAVCACGARAAEFENRWVYFTTPLTEDANVREAEKVIASAKANGLNGLVLACGLEFFTCWPGDRLPRLRAIQRACEEAGLEIVPSMFSLGYGSMCNYGISLLEGVPVEGWTYVAKGGRLVPAEKRPVDVGKVDRQIEHSMNRLLVGKVPVKDKARYRLSCRMRTRDFSAKRDLQLWALESGRKEFILLASRSFKFKPTQDWTLCEVEFNVPEGVTALSLYAGCQGGYQSGELDLDGFKLEQVAPVAVLKRDTAPVVVRNAKTGRTYAADCDFTVPKCSRAGADRGEPVKPTEFPIPEGSAIREGDVVTLDCYVLAVVDGAQVSTCLSEPALYGYIEKSVRKVEELLSPKKWQISIDEFRNGGTCAGCKARGLTMAQMYGDAVTKIHGFILAAHPGAEVHMWSDMLDPGHNGIERYYNCRGSFRDAWKYVPKDIVVDCWYDKKCETSLRFFEQKGFRTLAAAYYDEKPPFEYSRRWRDAARATKGCTGWMYTTWRKAYGDLPAFCEVMSAREETLKVTGTGNDDTHVRMKARAVEPSTAYAVTCRMRHPEGKDVGVAVLTADGVSMYKRPVGNGWMAFTNVFMTAADTKSVTCELRQWHIPGDFEFADIRFEKVTPRYRTVDGLQLGFGESVDGRDYHYGTSFSSASHTQSRPLVAVRSAPFANGCISFGGRTSLEFVHELPGRTFRSGRVGLLCDRISSGAVTVALSADGRTWTDALTVTNAGFHAADVPAALLPSAKIRARVSAASGTSAAIRHYSFDARLKGAPAFGFGATDYVDAAGRTLHVEKPWDYLSDVTSGERLPGGMDGIACWRQSSGRKVFRGRPVPTVPAKALRLATARNEEEAVQFVIRPSEDLANVRVTAELEGDFTVEVRRVGYLDIGFLADGMGARGSWPDPIFVQDPDGCAIAADENQPFWVTVKPGKGAAAGIHRGSVSVSSSKGAFRVPLEVRVFGFDFPDRVSCESAFGLTWKTVFAYQHLRTPEEKREVVEKYLAHFARHHISPYAPVPMLTDPSYRMKWTKAEREEDSVPVIDWTEWDAEIDRVLAKYAFTTFKFHLRGIGFGDMTGTKGVRSINGAKEGTELFETYLSRYLSAVEDHLKEKGLLDRAYIYVFDEPRPEHFAYANESLARIRKYAPGLRRMVTVEPREEFVGGVNLWCPITESFDRAKSAAAQARGEEVWWYITFSSVPPKVNEHVEHAGVDMRVWLWQTWFEKVTGILIWETVHWNTQRIYTDPEHPQNPYEDTVCWGGSHPWNSGEGRYVFPPPRCFETKDPVVEGPVDSIRFEMLREGIEDYEYFAMLKRLDPVNPLLAVPQSVTTSLDDYAKDPAGMERHRLRLACELERISAGKGK